MIDFLDIVGQDDALAELQQSLAADRMPHAFLFLGPGGVGRRTTATALAKLLLCESPSKRPNLGRLPALDKDFQLQLPCGACPGCKMMDSGAHPDFHSVYKELARYHESSQVRSRVMQDLGIDVIRGFLIDAANRASTRRRGKVFVVLEAELMSEPAQNALLKTLEEPPPLVRIILLCRSAGEMLPTTLSRCRQVHFRPLPRAFVREHLARGGLPAEESAFWAAFTNGSIGTALRMAAGGMYAIKRDVVDRLAALGKSGSAEVAEHLAKLAEKLADAALTQAKQEQGVELSKLLATRRAGGWMIELIASAFRDTLSLATSAPREAVNVDQPAAIAALAKRFSPLQLAEIIEQLSEYEQLLWRNVNPRLIWDNLAITAASAAPLRL
ncbi:MAG: DNA polymerase III subunit delta' C-terminal domain-containing protein [Phycisphaerae bacterium]|jgi:DNA polymerase-3 subunit delta'